MSFTQKLINVSFSMGTGSFGGGTSSGNTVNLTGLRISCKISKAGGYDMGLLDCAIYGMKLSDMNQLSCVGTQQTNQGKNSITVQAGDAVSGMSTVFVGTITLAFVDAQSMPEVCFRVTAQAGAIEAVMPSTPTSINGTGDVATMMGQIASSLGLKFENNGVNVKLSNPYHAFSYRDQAQSIAEAAGIEWIIDNGTLAIWNPGQARQGASTTISKTTGMVGYPAFNQAGIIVTTQFQGTIQFGTSITVQSDLTPACGSWVITNLEYELDAMIPHGKWFVVINACRIGGGSETD